MQRLTMNQRNSVNELFMHEYFRHIDMVIYVNVKICDRYVWPFDCHLVTEPRSSSDRVPITSPGGANKQELTIKTSEKVQPVERSRYLVEEVDVA